MQKIYKEVEDGFKSFEENEGVVYIYSGKFREFVKNALPSSWRENVSKGFAGLGKNKHAGLTRKS